MIFLILRDHAKVRRAIFKVEKKMKQKQTATLIFILTTSIVLILSGCATPVSVKHVDIQTAYGIQTASAISSNQPSEASSIVLRQHGLLDRFEKEPAVVLAELHKGLKPVDDDDPLFALAELSLLHAQHTNDPALYLDSDLSKGQNPRLIIGRMARKSYPTLGIKPVS